MDPDRIAMPPPQSPITTWDETIELNNHLFLWKTHLSSNCIYHHQPGRPDKPDSGGGEGAGNLLALKMKLTWKFLPLVSVPMIIHYGCDGDKVDDDDDIERMNMMTMVEKEWIDVYPLHAAKIWSHSMYYSL